MEQNYTNNQNDFLWSLLANPASDAHQYTYNLQRLVNDFPQSGILQAMLAHASDDKNLRQASAYFNPKSLYKLVNSPSSFIGIADEKIIYQGSFAANGHTAFNGTPPVFQDITTPAVEDTTSTAAENYFSETPVVEPAPLNQLNPAELLVEAEPLNTLHLPDVAAHGLPPAPPLPQVPETVAPASGTLHTPYTTLNESFISQPVTAPVENPLHTPYVSLNESLASQLKETGEIAPDQNAAPETAVVIPPPIPEAVYEHIVTPTHIEVNSYQEAPVIIAAPPAVEPVDAEVKPEPVRFEAVEPAPVIETPVQQPIKAIDEEVFDEITGIEQINVAPQIPPVAPTPQPVRIPEEKPAPEPLIKHDPDKPFVYDIADTDPFRFKGRFSYQKQAAQGESQEAATPVPSEKLAERVVITSYDTENQTVSKYHDEKMPYTFMWWLDKTRKEYAGIYQPYIKAESRGVVNNSKKPAIDELQQQYYENIFHITSVEELNKTADGQPAPFFSQRREQGIIERFIKEEPQIRPQSSDKLDNENKAKKSSEDRDEIVTETLAAIYTEQMLYHKAIASYRKLMLKFPEKSRYFASKIEQLEKKTN